MPKFESFYGREEEPRPEWLWKKIDFGDRDLLLTDDARSLAVGNQRGDIFEALRGYKTLDPKTKREDHYVSKGEFGKVYSLGGNTEIAIKEATVFDVDNSALNALNRYAILKEVFKRNANQIPGWMHLTKHFGALMPKNFDHGKQLHAENTGMGTPERIKEYLLMEEIKDCKNLTELTKIAMGKKAIDPDDSFYPLYEEGTLLNQALAADNKYHEFMMSLGDMIGPGHADILYNRTSANVVVTYTRGSDEEMPFDMYMVDL